MGDLQKQQEEIQKKLETKEVTEEVQGIKIVGNAAKKIISVSIQQDIFDKGDKEMLEDLMIEAFNRFMASAVKIEAEETKKLMNDMLPPGFEDLFKQ